MKDFCSYLHKLYEGAPTYDIEWIVKQIKKFENKILPPPSKKRPREPDPDAEWGTRVRRR